jgi:hypothetical protein
MTHPRLSAGQLEGQRVQQTARQLIRRDECDALHVPSQPRSGARVKELQIEQLLERQPPPGGLDGIQRRGTVKRLERPGEIR